MTHHEITKKLIGEITPIGEANTDNERYENLEATIELVYSLVSDLKEVAKNSNRPEWSVKKAGMLAATALEDLSREMKSTTPSETPDQVIGAPLFNYIQDMTK